MTDAYPGGYYIKLNYNQEDSEGSMTKVLLTHAGPGKGRGKGRGRPSSAARPPPLDFDLSNADIPPRYPAGGIIIKDDKMRDLDLLVPYMSNHGKDWVFSLKNSQNSLRRAMENIPEEDEEEVADDPADDYDPDYEAVVVRRHEN